MNERHTGRLARCPECGGVTHPLAQHLAEAANPSSQAKPAGAEQTADPITCANCGQTLGKLQKPRKWKKQPVCGPCYRVLSHDKRAAEAMQAPAATTAIQVRPADTMQPTMASPRAILVDVPGQAPLPLSISTIVRGACIGIVVTAAALYLIFTVLQSLGIFIVWSVIILSLLALTIWIRRRVLSLKEKFQAVRRPRDNEGTIEVIDRR